MRTPLTKFAYEPCKARPDARPVAAIIAANEVVLTPSFAKIASTNNIFKDQLTKFLKNFL